MPKCPNCGSDRFRYELRSAGTVSKNYYFRKLHYVFDTGSGGIMTRARFWGKKGSFEPSCEVNRKMLKSGVDPAILLHRYKNQDNWG
jgi:hypothetical protein